MPLQSALPSRLASRSGGWSRDRWFRAVLVALVLVQLAAFWMLCSHQVRKAQMRDMSLEVQRVAVADCLQYIPRATLNSCAHRVDPARQDAAAAAMSSAAAVGISYR